MTELPANPITFPATRFALVLTGAALVAAGVAVVICVSLGRTDTLVVPCLAAAGVSLFSFLASFEPMRRGALTGVGRLAQMAMLSMGIRLILILLGITVLVHGVGLASRPTALFAVGFYLLLMLVDVPMLVGLLRRAGAEGTPSAPTARDVIKPRVGSVGASEVHS